jgi:hypothetical protein
MQESFNMFRSCFRIFITISHMPFIRKGILLLSSHTDLTMYHFVSSYLQKKCLKLKLYHSNSNTFASCSTDFDPDDRPWCSTKADDGGVHVPGEGEFGFCPDSCLTNILSTPSPNFPNELPSWSTWLTCSALYNNGSHK